MEDTLLDLINQTELEEEAAFISGDESYIYAISCPELSVVKIGVSGSPDNRLATLQACFPCDLHHEAVWVGSFAEEQEIHRKLSTYRKRSEWFRMTPSDAVRTISTLLGRQPVWQPDRIFKKECTKELLPKNPAHIQAFIDKWVIFASDSRVVVGAFYAAYLKWCKIRGGKSLRKVEFTRIFTDQSVTKEKRGGQIWLLGVGLLAKPRTGTP